MKVRDYDPAWPHLLQTLAGRICSALGSRQLSIERVGSTVVEELAAKDMIDIDVIVYDPSDESDYVPAPLEAIG